MPRQNAHPRQAHGLSRRELLQAGLAAGVILSSWPPSGPLPLWGEEAGSPKHGGLLRVRGRDPVHFDPHLTRNQRTQAVLSFVYSKLLRHKVGPDVRPGTYIVEPDLAERWEAPDDTTYIFHLRQGVKWHNKPPVNGRELVAEDVKFTFDRFLMEQGNPERQLLESVDRVEVVDRYTVKFLLHEPFVWLLNILASAICMWIIAPEVAEKYGDLKKVETAIGTGPFLLERYEPNVKIVFRRNPEYFRQGLPYVDGVEWLVLDDESTALAMYRTGQTRCGPRPPMGRAPSRPRLTQAESSPPALPGYAVQHQDDDLDADRSAPLHRRTRAACHLPRHRSQGLIEAVWMRGQPSPAVAPGLAEWSLPIDQLGEGAKYYRYDPQEARRLLAEAGHPKGFKTTLTASNGYGRDLIDAAQLVQRYLKEVGLEAELKLQEYGAYQATTGQGKFEGLAMGPYGGGWEPDSPLYGPYTPNQPRNRGHVNDPKLAAMVKEQRRLKDPEARKQLIFAIQRYAAEQEYYVYLSSQVITASWQPYVKNYAPNLSADFGSRVAALWLDR